MLSNKVFGEWFKAEVETRWAKHHFEWIEIGDWHWRLREFDIDTLTEAVRQHKTIDDWRDPSLKKVYGYAQKIHKANHPKQIRKGKQNTGVPEAHTYIMCVGKSDNGRGCVGWFVPILVWPFTKTYTASTYARIAEEQRLMHSRNGRNGIWEIFTGTTHGEMLKRSCRLRD